jgi:hypothetical protein
MTANGFVAMLAGKVNLLAPVFGPNIRVHDDFPLSNRKMRNWYVHMKKTCPAGMAALNQGGMVSVAGQYGPQGAHPGK